MASILIFLSLLAIIATWWLSKQGLASKPWLEQGTITDLPMATTAPTSPAKIGLGVFLAVAGSLFALFISAYSMRMQLPDWRTLPLPKVLWLNTGMLLLSSFTLHGAQTAARRRETNELRLNLLAAGIATLAFLSGQLLAWRQLTDEGYALASNSANAFFYLISGVHGLHVLGGLGVLTRIAEKAWRGATADRLRPGVELCAIYWHFLLVVWLIFLSVLTGWAGEFADICRQLLD